MPASNRRHVEFFGPDLGRGPFSSNSPPVAAVQIAAALAQVRAPLLRSDSEIEAHVDFIRALADRLFPDFASQIRFNVGAEDASDNILTQILDDSGQYSLLECWLADAKGGGVSTVDPVSVTWGAEAVVLQTIVTRRHFKIIGPTTGLINATVKYLGDHTYYWAVARQGRVYYSSGLDFT
jgi:hypothetical protein